MLEQTQYEDCSIQCKRSLEYLNQHKEAKCGCALKKVQTSEHRCFEAASVWPTRTGLAARDPQAVIDRNLKKCENVCSNKCFKTVRTHPDAIRTTKISEINLNVNKLE